MKRTAQGGTVGTVRWEREPVGAGTGRKRDQGLNVQRQSQQVEQPRRGIFKDHKTTLTDLQSEREREGASEREIE